MVVKSVVAPPSSSTMIRPSTEPEGEEQCRGEGGGGEGGSRGEEGSSGDEVCRGEEVCRGGEEGWSGTHERLCTKERRRRRHITLLEV